MSTIAGHVARGGNGRKREGEKKDKREARTAPPHVALFAGVPFERRRPPFPEGGSPRIENAPGNFSIRRVIRDERYVNDSVSIGAGNNFQLGRHPSAYGAHVAFRRLRIRGSRG